MESPDSPVEGSLKKKGTNSTTVKLPANGHSKLLNEESEDKYINSSLGKSVSTEDLKKKPILRFFCDNLITFATLFGVMAGIGLGFGLKSAKKWTKREIMYVNFPGELFLNMLKCMIIPLITSSLISAIGNLDTSLSGKIGCRAVVYYFSTTILAVILGIVLVMTIRPGTGGLADVPKDNKDLKPQLTEDTLMDLVRNMFPPNIIEACIKQFSTVLIPPKGYNKSDIHKNKSVDYRTWEWKGKMAEGTNILGLVVFSVVLGVTLGEMKQKGKPLLNVFTCLSDAIMSLTRVVIWLSPVGVMFLVASKMIEMDDIAAIAGSVGLYTATILIGIFIHGFILLPLIYFLFVRKNPYTFLIRMGQALATAFGTSSSSATLPITIQCLEENNHIDSRVTRFCSPIGATINMDGTALYEAVAAIFIAQMRGITLSIGSIIAISITATAASIGAAGIPQAGLVTMVMVLNVVGLPAEDVTLILVVDWMLDRFRTTINVLGDAYGAGIVAHYSKDDLEELNYIEDTNVEMTPL